MMNDAEMLWEERILLENLAVTDCMFHDTTVLNTYTIQGHLPEEKSIASGRHRYATVILRIGMTLSSVHLTKRRDSG